MTDEVLQNYALNPEAFRHSIVDETKWSWRDELASAAHSQDDYDRRRLEALRSGNRMAPSRGWTFEDRVLARGWVDAVLETIQKMDPQKRQEVLRAMCAPEAPPETGASGVNETP